MSLLARTIALSPAFLSCESLTTEKPVGLIATLQMWPLVAFKLKLIPLVPSSLKLNETTPSVKLASCLETAPCISSLTSDPLMLPSTFSHFPLPVFQPSPKPFISESSRTDLSMVTIFVFESAEVSAEMPSPTIDKIPLIMSAKLSLINPP